jgi:hypothetical protein
MRIPFNRPALRVGKGVETNEVVFAEATMGIEYIVYDYPEYEQLYPPYDPGVSVLDRLFMKGREAPEYTWSSEKARSPAPGRTA